MKPGTLRLGFKLGFLLAVLVVCALALSRSQLPGTEMLWDKASHFMAFLVLAFLLDYAVLGYWPKWVGLVLFGLGIEIAQWFTGYRYFELQDLAADALGVGGYLVLRPQVAKIPMLRSLSRYH